MVAEQPFKLFQRPRPQGAVQAAVEDEQLARWNVGGTGDAGFISNRKSYHPAARVLVETTVLNGHLPRRARRGLSQDGILAQARKYGYWPFRLCYEDGLRREQTLQGQTIVRFSINAAGRVSAARLVETKLQDEHVARCLADRSGELTYRPGPGRRIDVRMSIKLWPGDAPVPLVGPPMEDPPSNPGQLAASQLERSLEAIQPALRQCYRDGLARDPQLWGRLQLRVDQAADGHLVSVREDESRFPDPTVVRCAVCALRVASLPKPKGGSLSFVYAVRLGRMPAAQ